MPKLPWFYIIVYILLAMGLVWLAIARILPAPGSGPITKTVVLSFFASVLLAGFLSMMKQWRERDQ